MQNLFINVKTHFMRQIFLSLTGYLFIITFLVTGSCKRDPYIADFKNIKGYVIGKESCNSDDSNDYWLIDFTYGTSNPKVGDTVLLNGTTYTNVLKTKGLDHQLKTVGLRVSIDYRVISTDKVITTGCNIASPVTYNIKELTILNQGEIR